jgi:DNA-binding NarL/FixJ family response regulator
MNAIHLIIADDHPIFRQGLRQVIESAHDLRIVAEASNGAAAWTELITHHPQVAVLDVEMPEQDGFELARRVRAERLPIALVFLTMYKKERFINAAFDLGVKGYVLKDSAAAEIIDCIRAVAAGKNFISPALTNYLVNRTRRATELLHEAQGIAALTAGVAFSRTLSLPGVPAGANPSFYPAYSFPGFPSWLSLNSTTGVLSGAPPYPGTFN